MPKGRKICKSCGKENGVRASQCSCGNEFTKKEPNKEPEPTIFVDRSSLMRVYTPGTGAGEKYKLPIVPVKPDGLKVSEWIEACQRWGEKHNMTYTANAFRCMATRCWKGEELQQAFDLIIEDFANQVEPNYEMLDTLEKVTDIAKEIKPKIDKADYFATEEIYE